MSEKKVFSIERISFLAAICMFLSVVEYAIPKPLPFLRFGLANLPILISIKKLSVREILTLILLKILMQALVSGTLFSYIILFSLSGSIASGLIMLIGHLIFYRTGFVSNIGLSLMGSFANCSMQLICTRFLMFGQNVKYVAPILLISSFITGLALGIFANIFENRSRWFSEFCGNPDAFKVDVSKNTEFVHRKSTSGKMKCKFVENLWKNSVFRLIFSLVFMLILMFVKNLWVQISIVSLFFILVAIKKRGKIRWIPSLVVLISVTFFSLLTPLGKVLFTLGSWKITLGALISGLQRSFLLIGMVYISQFAVDKSLSLPGKIGSSIGYVFLIYDRLTVEKTSFKGKNAIALIDEKLIQVIESLKNGRND